jgi:hypothetical protein
MNAYAYTVCTALYIVFIKRHTYSTHLGSKLGALSFEQLGEIVSHDAFWKSREVLHVSGGGQLTPRGDVIG